MIKSYIEKSIKNYKPTTFTKKGIKYYHTYPFWLRPIYSLFKLSQWVLWKIKIPWHDTYFNECTPDGNCCVNISHDISTFDK